MRLPGWVGPVCLAAFFASLASWSWEKWADVHIDFGAELYTAWRLAEGDVLYRDIAYRQGPLPHHVNALWFALFGVSVRTLALCNLAVLAGIAALQWDLFRRACGVGAANLATAVLLGVFAFAQYVPIGNFNYVTPYHHHQTHGLLLALGLVAAFAAAWRPPGAGGAGWHAVAGLCLGGLFLTKAELFAPAAAAAALALAVSLRLGRERRVAALAAFAAAALALPLAALVWLGARMPLALAARGVAGNWVHLGGLSGDAFYLRGAGLDEPLANLLAALLAAAGVALFAAALVALERGLPRRLAPTWSAAVGVAAFALLAAWPGGLPWLSAARALPLAVGVVLALLLRDLWRRRDAPDFVAHTAPLAVYAVFAWLLLGKMILRARFEHYGFALAMPATLLLVAALYELPRRWPGRAAGSLARPVVAGVVAAGVLFCLGRSAEFYGRKDFAVGEGADRIVSYNPHTSLRPRLVAEALARLEGLMPAGSTLVVLPEGASLNYWLRKQNPTGFLLFLPTEIAAFGEPAMLAALRADPPDFVALLHRPSAEFGTGPFGVDPRNGRGLRRFVDRHYRPVGRLGAEPFAGEGFGVVVLRRADPPDRIP